MKPVITIFLLLAFAVQTFRSGFVMMSYYTNPVAFAKNCVNKAKPKMHCNGKCQMMKKMQEEEEKDQQAPEMKTKNPVEIFLATQLQFTPNLGTSTLAMKAITVDISSSLYDISYSFFHPPQS